MKKLLILFAFTLFAAGANAQGEKAKAKTNPDSKTTAKKQTEVTKQASNDYYTRTDGKIMIMKGGTMQAIEKEVLTFDNGNTLSREGVLVYNNGTEKMMIEEGMKVDMMGNVVRDGKGSVEVKDKPASVEPEKAE